MRVVVVIPTYQEVANIATAIEGVRTSVPDAGVLVVDDSSPDGTADRGPGTRRGGPRAVRDVRGSAPPTAPDGRTCSTRATT